MLHLLPLDGAVNPLVESGSADGPAEQVSKGLQGSELIRTLGAGWASKADLAFLLPLLAAAHDAAVNANEDHEGDPAAPQEVGIRAELDIIDRQRGRYDAALAALTSPRVDRRDLPVAVKFFALQCQAARRGAPAPGAQEFIQVGQQVSALVLQAIERGFYKAGIDARWPAPPIQTRPPRETAISAATTRCRDDAIALHTELHTELYRALRFERIRAACDRIQARHSLETEQEPPIALYPGVGEIMFTEDDQARDIAFTVERYPCTAEVLDPEWCGYRQEKPITAISTRTRRSSISSRVRARFSWVRPGRL